MLNDKISNPIAKDIMTPRVYTLPSSAHFRDLIHLMYEKGVSAIFILDEDSGKFYLISHTDVVKFLETISADGSYCNEDIFNTKLREIMKGPVKIIEEDTPLDLIIRYMSEHGYKRVLVGKDGHPVGVISTRDIILWNNKYFSPAKPIALLVIENFSTILIAKKIFRRPTKDAGLDKNLIELYGSALKSISKITDEVLKDSSEMRVLQKDNYTILFENNEYITSILICDNLSIELKRRLIEFTQRFTKKYYYLIANKDFQKFAKTELDIEDLIDIFSTSKF